MSSPMIKLEESIMAFSQILEDIKVIKAGIAKSELTGSDAALALGGVCIVYDMRLNAVLEDLSDACRAYYESINKK